MHFAVCVFEKVCLYILRHSFFCWKKLSSQTSLLYGSRRVLHISERFVFKRCICAFRDVFSSLRHACAFRGGCFLNNACLYISRYLCCLRRVCTCRGCLFEKDVSAHVAAGCFVNYVFVRFAASCCFLTRCVCAFRGVFVLLVHVTALLSWKRCVCVCVCVHSVIVLL